MRRDERSRRLLTVLFTDIVGSTEIARQLEDRRWQHLLERFRSVVRQELRRNRGHEVDTAGDGFLATFEQPELAVRCSWAITNAVRELGLEVRTGLHTGEVETRGGRVGGIAVHTAARIVGLAGPGDVLVSGTVRDLAAGSGIEFQDRGRRRLKGLPGTWSVCAAIRLDGEMQTRPLDPEAAADRRRQSSEPPRRRRRALVLSTMAFAVLVGAIVGFVGLSDREPPVSPMATTGGFLLEFDPAALRVLRSVPVTEPGPLNGPADVAVGEGGIWVIRTPRDVAGLAPNAGTTLARIDPETGMVTQTTPLHEFPGTFRIAVGERAVWVLSIGPAPIVGGASVLTQVNPATVEVLSSRRHTFREIPSSLAIGEEAVWILTLRGTLLKIDPVSNTKLLQRDVATAGGAVGTGEGAVWIVDSLQDVLLRIDPTTGRASRPLELPGTPETMAVGEGAVWILDKSNGTLIPVDTDTGELGEAVALGTAPTDIAVAAGAVWVISGTESVMWRVDPLSRKTEEIPLPGLVPGSVATDEGQRELWIWAEARTEEPR